jgi:predicted amidohydrolase
MKVVRAAAVQLSPVIYSREGTVDEVVRQIRDLGQQGVQFATFPETIECEVLDQDDRLVAKATSTCVVLRGDQARRIKGEDNRRAR